MSWSVTIIGNPDRVVEQLSAYSEQLSGQSKIEYDEARPHLQALVIQNVGENIIVNLSASGHATFDSESKKTNGNCCVSLSAFYGKLAL